MLQVRKQAGKKRTPQVVISYAIEILKLNYDHSKTSSSDEIHNSGAFHDPGAEALVHQLTSRRLSTWGTQESTMDTQQKVNKQKLTMGQSPFLMEQSTVYGNFEWDNQLLHDHFR